MIKCKGCRMVLLALVLLAVAFVVWSSNNDETVFQTSVTRIAVVK